MLPRMISALTEMKEMRWAEMPLQMPALEPRGIAPVSQVCKRPGGPGCSERFSLELL